MRDYELVVLVAKDNGKQVQEQVEKVAKEKGKVNKVEPWGVKPLSYPVKKQTEAAYFWFHLSLESDGPVVLDRALRVNEQVLRHLLVRKVATSEVKVEKVDEPEKKESKPKAKAKKETKSKKVTKKK